MALLVETGLLDSEAEPIFDDLAELVTQLTGAPIALVSLVDAHRQWFKARVGLDATETPRDISFCGHVAADREPLLVPDATEDERFADNPLVAGAPHIRSYFGFPLAVEDGHVMGTLCAIDTEPRGLTEEQVAQLTALARQVALIVQSRIDARRAAWRAAVVQSSDDAIMSVDLTGRIVAWNPAAETLFGWSEDEAIGLHISAMAPSDADAEIQRRSMSRVRPGEIRHFETRRRGKDGRLVEVSVTPHVIHGPDGEVIGYSKVLRDLSELKKLEKLEHDFISTISHELRTPLTSIRGAIGLVLGGVAGELPESSRHMLEIVKSNSDRLLRLVNDILDVQAIESGRVMLEVQPVDLVDTLARSVASLGHLADERGVTLVFEPADSHVVQADPFRIAQVVDNLLANALKFSPSGGRVRLELSRAAVVPGGARVSVTDEGPGIPATFRGRIFNRFAKADSEHHRNVVGTGLGLSISRTLVELHAGTIGYDSVEGEGATFWFELPVGL